MRLPQPRGGGIDAVETSFNEGTRGVLEPSTRRGFLCRLVRGHNTAAAASIHYDVHISPDLPRWGM